MIYKEYIFVFFLSWFIRCFHDDLSQLFTLDNIVILYIYIEISKVI